MRLLLLATSVWRCSSPKCDTVSIFLTQQLGYFPWILSRLRCHSLDRIPTESRIVKCGNSCSVNSLVLVWWLYLNIWQRRKYTVLRLILKSCCLAFCKSFCVVVLFWVFFPTDIRTASQLLDVIITYCECNTGKGTQPHKAMNMQHN